MVDTIAAFVPVKIAHPDAINLQVETDLPCRKCSKRGGVVSYDLAGEVIHTEDDGTRISHIRCIYCRRESLDRRTFVDAPPVPAVSEPVIGQLPLFPAERKVTE